MEVVARILTIPTNRYQMGAFAKAASLDICVMSLIAPLHVLQDMENASLDLVTRRSPFANAITVGKAQIVAHVENTLVVQVQEHAYSPTNASVLIPMTPFATSTKNEAEIFFRKLALYHRHTLPTLAEEIQWASSSLLNHHREF